MERVQSAEFKKDFGRVMEEVQHANITITRHGRDIATMISQKKLNELKLLLAEYPLSLVESGEMDVLEALIFQNRILTDVEKAREDYKDGKCKTFEETFNQFNL